MEKIWSDDAWNEYIYWQKQDKKTFKRINALIKSIEREGVMEGIGKPESLKYRNGYSRRIDETNRLVYDVVDGKLLILCKLRSLFHNLIRLRVGAAPIRAFRIPRPAC